MSVRGSASARGPIAAGILLVVAGAVLLAVRVAGISFDWPALIVIAGFVALGLAVALGYGAPGTAEAGSAIAVVGGIVTALGLVLGVQESTGAYASWAYAWALVAPGGVGLGLLVYGLALGRWDIARGGLGALLTGIVLFVVFFVFFEGVFDLTSLGDEWLTGSAVPLVFIGLGVLFLIAALVPRRWRGQGPVQVSSGGTYSVGGAYSVGGTYPGGGPPTADARGEPPGDLETIAVDLAGASAGEVAIAFGAGRLAIIGPATAGHLVDGDCFGGVKREDLAPGRIRLSTPTQGIWQKAWDQAPFDWRLGLSAEVPLRLSIEVGAARTEADLSALRVAELRVRTGAADTAIVLPAAAGATRVDVEGGAATVKLQVPTGVAARIRSTMAIGTTGVDETRFPRDPFGGWASPDFASAANRVEIDVRGGLGSVSIR